MVKKYVALALITGAVITGLLTTRSYLNRPGTSITVDILQTQLVERTVLCSGTVETADSRPLYADVSCIADQVLYKAGDSVKKGDVLFTVDVDATKEVLATMGGISPDLLPDSAINRDVVAPVSGVLSQLNVTAGQAFDSSKPYAVISSSEDLQVKIAIREKNIKNAAVGQSVRVSGTAFQKTYYHGTLTYIAPSARQQYVGSVSETVVDAIVTLNRDELDDSLRMGLSAKARLVVGSTPEALVVPYAYVQQDDKQQEYVYLYENGHAVKRVITTCAELSNGFQIASGLSAGDAVICEPDRIHKNGEAVQREDADNTSKDK